MTIFAEQVQRHYILRMCEPQVSSTTMRMSPIVICGLSDSTVFFHIMSKSARFSEKMNIKFA